MKKVMVMSFWGHLISPLLMLFLVTGCSDSDSSNDNTPDTSGGNNSQLKKTTSDTELLGHIRSALLQRYGVVSNYPVYPSYPTVDTDGASEGVVAPDVSGTNVQESGVDEADRIKSDGKYLYVVTLRPDSSTFSPPSAGIAF